MANESGHPGTASRRPQVYAKGVLNAPHRLTQPSDKQLSPRGWFFERALLFGNESMSAERPMSPEELQRQRRQINKFRARARLAAENARKEREWDPTVHKVMPPSLVGIKPITEEPWTRDARVYAAKFGSFEREANVQMDGTKVEEYNDESVLDSNNGYRSQITATGLRKNASIGGQPIWDSSPFRPCPYVLRGMKPVTREPWVFDERVYNKVCCSLWHLGTSMMTATPTSMAPARTH